MKALNKFFETNVEIPRIKVGKKQTLETLINEEALLLAKFLRYERKTWNPRITQIRFFERGKGLLRLQTED